MSGAVRRDWTCVVLNFGKYQGKTLGDVARIAPDYIAYLNSTHQPQSIANAVRAAHLATMTQARPKYVPPDRSAAFAAYRAAALSIEAKASTTQTRQG